MALAEELVRVGMPAGQAVVVPNGTVAAVTATSSSTTLTAVVISAGVNRVTGSDGVKLPAMNQGSSVMIVNDTNATVRSGLLLGGLSAFLGPVLVWQLLTQPIATRHGRTSSIPAWLAGPQAFSR